MLYLRHLLEILAMTKTLLALTVLTALTGCAGFGAPVYECGLDETPGAKCASMEQAYARVKRVDPKVKSTSIFEDKTSKETHEDAKPFFQGKESEFPEPGQQGMPVFTQPKVHRVWVAPYVDGDGNLRTGEYTYFSTAGSWGYGTTRKSGAAAGIFGPAKPGNLGFNPVDIKKAPAAAPAKPPSTTSSVPPMLNSQAKVPTKSAADITAPYQTLKD